MNFHDISLSPNTAFGGAANAAKCILLDRTNIQKHLNMAQNDLAHQINWIKHQQLEITPSLKQTVRPWKMVVGKRSFPCWARSLFFRGGLVSFKDRNPKNTHLNFTDASVIWKNLKLTVRPLKKGEMWLIVKKCKPWTSQLYRLICDHPKQSEGKTWARFMFSDGSQSWWAWKWKISTNL